MTRDPVLAAEYEGAVSALLTVSDAALERALLAAFASPAGPGELERAAMTDERTAERVYRTLGVLRGYLAGRDPAAPGVPPSAMPLLKGRLKAEREAMGPLISDIRDRRKAESATSGVNAVAHRITGKVHHRTLATARALLRQGLDEAEVLARLRRQR